VVARGGAEDTGVMARHRKPDEHVGRHRDGSLPDQGPRRAISGCVGAESIPISGQPHPVRYCRKWPQRVHRLITRGGSALEGGAVGRCDVHKCVSGAWGQ